MALAFSSTTMAPRAAGAAGSLSRPALAAWVAGLDRERRRMGIVTQEGFAQWVGVDPADWSRWRRGKIPVPGHQGRRLVALFNHEPRWMQLWLRLVREQEEVAMLADRSEVRPPPAS